MLRSSDVGLWDAIFRGAGARLGAEAVERGLEKLTDPERAEAERKRKQRLMKVGAVVVVIVSVFGLLFLSGLFADLFRWLLGAAFVAGLGGGAYYLLRGKLRKLRASYEEKSEARRIEADAEAKERAVREQLEALKKKQR